MDKEEADRVLELYPEFTKIYGPYVYKDNRKRVVLYDGKRCSSRQLAKVRLEIKLGRRLIEGETVDHIDEDYTNDDPDNLQLLSQSKNATKSHRINGKVIQSDVDQVCVICGINFRHFIVRQTCGDSNCKSKNRSRISKELCLIPPRWWEN